MPDGESRAVTLRKIHRNLHTIQKLAIRAHLQDIAEWCAVLKTKVLEDSEASENTDTEVP